MTFLTTKIITRLLVVTALAVSPARAYCYYNSFGTYVCDSDLSYTGRVLIGLGIMAFFLAIIGGIFMRRRSVMRERNNAYLLNQQQAVNVQYPPPPPGGWGNPAPGGPSQYPPYPPKNEYGQYQAGYTGGFSATPQEPPKTYNPGQPGYPPYGAAPPGYFPSPAGPPPALNNETRPNQAPTPYSV